MPCVYVHLMMDMSDCYLIRTSLCLLFFSSSLLSYVLLYPPILPHTHLMASTSPPIHSHAHKRHTNTHLPESRSRCWWEWYVGPEYEQESVRRRCRGLCAHPTRTHVPPETSCPAWLPLLWHGGRCRLLGPACRLHQDQTHRRGRERGKEKIHKDSFLEFLVSHRCKYVATVLRNSLSGFKTLMNVGTNNLIVINS